MDREIAKEWLFNAMDIPHLQDFHKVELLKQQEKLEIVKRHRKM